MAFHGLRKGEATPFDDAGHSSGGPHLQYMICAPRPDIHRHPTAGQQIDG